MRIKISSPALDEAPFPPYCQYDEVELAATTRVPGNIANSVCACTLASLLSSPKPAVSRDNTKGCFSLRDTPMTSLSRIS